MLCSGLPCPVQNRELAHGVGDYHTHDFNAGTPCVAEHLNQVAIIYIVNSRQGDGRVSLVSVPVDTYGVNVSHLAVATDRQI